MLIQEFYKHTTLRSICTEVEDVLVTSVTAFMNGTTMSCKDVLPEILAKDTKVVNACCPRISSTSASFKTGMVSSVAICRMINQISFFLGICVVISVLSIITDTPGASRQ